MGKFVGFLLLLLIVGGAIYYFVFLPQKESADRPEKPGQKAPGEPTQGVALKRGASFRLTHEVQLIQRSGSGDSAEEKIRYVNPGGMITILGRREKDSRVSFRVSAVDHRGEKMGEGWVRETALKAQRLEPVSDAERLAPSSAPRRYRTSTLIGVIEKNEDGQLVFTPKTSKYGKAKKTIIYLLDSDEPAREVFEAAGGEKAPAIVIAEVIDDRTPPLLKVKSAKPFKRGP